MCVLSPQLSVTGMCSTHRGSDPQLNEESIPLSKPLVASSHQGQRDDSAVVPALCICNVAGCIQSHQDVA